MSKVRKFSSFSATIGFSSSVDRSSCSRKSVSTKDWY